MVNGDSFSIATLIYARLRRVSGRVIDAIYLSENKEYAKHVIELAEATQDHELLRLVEKLRQVFNLFADQDESLTEINRQGQEDLIRVEPTEEDIYRAQVSHHYIGSLR
ncbi:hypothetical protein BS636_14920 [Acinetobacter sp. LoGeW2-3]|uniref:hypothetical protein n=1 Tax=Acinetobacter sp. LoGeW2-3 TaxID=1808001 RepID=UPI000C05CB23|nr:hypothetical protein [Acinetobacter sp. LoGeW2-3]ATO20878.1 hypothetical protein BS636_14920 [Acinetobacter sp. LoGeW2-3]